MKQPNRKHQRRIGSDGVDSRLKVRELDHIVLQLDVRIVGEVGEPHHADHKDHQVEGGQILKRLPNLHEEVPHRMLWDVRGIKFLQEAHRNRQNEDQSKH